MESQTNNNQEQSFASVSSSPESLQNYLSGSIVSSFLLQFAQSRDNIKFSKWIVKLSAGKSYRLQLLCLVFIKILGGSVFAQNRDKQKNSFMRFVVISSVICNIFLNLLYVLIPSGCYYCDFMRKYLRWFVYVNALEVSSIIGLATFHSPDVVFPTAHVINHTAMGLFMLVMIGFTFQELLPFHCCTIVFTLMFLTTTEQVLKNSIYFFTIYIIMVCLVYEREKLLRETFANNEMMKPQLLESQRNAAHDVRNALFEVYGLIEYAKRGYKIETKKSSFLPAPPINVEDDIVSKTEEKSTDSLKEKTNSKSETEAKKQMDATSLDATSLDATSLDATSLDALALRVRDITSQIVQRLDSSIRDGKSVLQNSQNSLKPVFESCNLRLIMEEELRLDDLIKFTVSKEFPESIETDVPWIRTILQNLIHNAKKHGPSNSIIDVHLSYVKNKGITIKVTDKGPGINPVRARDLFDPETTNTGIGLIAVQTYITGLKGTCGANGSTFWVKFPMDRINGLSMSYCLTFASSRAERIYRVTLSRAVSIPITIYLAIAGPTLFHFYFRTRPNTVGYQQPWIPVCFGLIQSYFLIQRLYHGKQATIKHVNNDIDGVVDENGVESGSDGCLGFTSYCCIRVRKHTIYWASHESMMHFYGWGLFVLILVADITNCIVVVTNYEGAGEYGIETWTPGGICILINALCIILVMDMQMKEIIIVLIVFISTRIIILCDSSNDIEMSARLINLSIVLGITLTIYKRKAEMRKNYRNGVIREDSRKDNRELELAALSQHKINKELITRKAVSDAAHKIAGCFHELLLAAQAIDKNIVVVQQEKEKKTNIDTNDTIYNFTMPTSKLERSRKMLKHAKEQFICFQDPRNIPNKTKTVVDISSISATQTDAIETTHISITDTESKPVESTTIEMSSTNMSSTNISSTANLANTIKILIVDDNDFCRDFVAVQVQECLQHIVESSISCQIDVIGDSVQQTLDHLSESTFEYDLVIVDMNIPGAPTETLAGLYLTKKYKTMNPTSTSKFVCLSGFGCNAVVIEQCRAVGMIKPYAIGKPLIYDELMDLLKLIFS